MVTYLQSVDCVGKASEIRRTISKRQKLRPSTAVHPCLFVPKFQPGWPVLVIQRVTESPGRSLQNSYEATTHPDTASHWLKRFWLSARGRCCRSFCRWLSVPHVRRLCLVSPVEAVSVSFWGVVCFLCCCQL
jgi:hypothetical protein